jgi:hypothetical protein
MSLTFLIQLPTEETSTDILIFTQIFVKPFLKLQLSFLIVKMKHYSSFNKNTIGSIWLLSVFDVDIERLLLII